MDRVVEMSTFVAVAEEAGFAAAARRLGMSPPTITRTISALEERIGARLLVRTTRNVRLTDAGLQFLEDARRILGELDEAEQGAAGVDAQPRGGLTITAPVLFGQMYVMPLLLDYLGRHPLVSANAILVDRVVNIVEEGIDVAFRIGHFPDSPLSTVPVGAVRRVLVATPDYVRRHEALAHPDQLPAHRIALPTGATASPEWRFRSGSDAFSVRVSPTLTVSTNVAAIQAAKSGWGLARVLSYQVAAELARGELVVLLADFEPPPLPVHVAYHGARRQSAKLMSFVEHAVLELSGALQSGR